MKQLLLLLLFCPFGQLAAQDLQQANLAWKYQPESPLQLSWELYQPRGAAPVLVMQLLQNQPARTRTLSGTIHYRDSLHQPNSLYTQPLFSSVPKGQAAYTFRHSIDTSRGAQWLVLELQHTTDSLTTYWYPLQLKDLLHFGPPPFYLQQQEGPSFASWLPMNESFSARLEASTAATSPSQAGGAAELDSLFVFVYELDFAPASSPMTMAPNTSGNAMEISRRLRIPASQRIQPEVEGFYFLQADTLTLKGQGIRAENKYFPKTRTLEAFAGPIRYLSTNEEWTELERENFSKQAIDRYWLRMTQSEERARRIIRSYYRRVTGANKLFTSFKEGWKTDQGMIYILYGPPDVVHQKVDGEVWVYKAKGDIPELSFTFVRTVNPFAPNYHQLVRDKNYARTHFQIVSRWRRGQNLP